MTINELLDIEQKNILEEYEELFLESKKTREKKKANKSKAGRERLVSAVKNRLQREGVTMSKSKIRNFAYEKYKLWKSKDKKVGWILNLERKAKTLGFDPRYYDGAGPGASSGVGAKEYSGRAYFFVGLVNGYVKELKQKVKRNGEKK